MMTQSHTGTVIGDAWVYDVAFRQAGIDTATEVDELVDRAAVPRAAAQRQVDRALRGLGVLTGTGGFATMTADLAETESIDVPEIPELTAWVQGLIPSLRCSNPLDATGVILSNLDIWDQLVTTYAARPELDALIFLSQFAPWDTRNRRFSDRFAEVSASSDKPFLLSPARRPGGGVDRGVPARLRHRDRQRAAGHPPRPAVPVEVHATAAVTPRSARRLGAPSRATRRPTLLERRGAMLTFADSMALFARAGIDVAPYEVVLPEDDPPTTSLSGPLVVKLADVAHRTEHDAVLLGVGRRGSPEAVARPPHRRASAGCRHGRRPAAARAGTARSSSGLRRLRARPRGGVRAGGRLRRGAATRERADSRRSAQDDAARDDRRVRRPRQSPTGSAADRPGTGPQLAGSLVAAGDLAAGARDWLRSLDVNPLIQTDAGFVAVDGVCFVADESSTPRATAGG